MILKRNAQQLIFTTTVIAMKDKEEKKTTVNPFTKAETGIQENSNQVFETLQITQKSIVL